MADAALLDAQADWLARVLGVRMPPKAGSSGSVSLVRLGKARIEWRDTLGQARGGMKQLKDAIARRYAGVDDAGGLVPAALDQLDRSMAALDDALFEQLDAVLNADAANRPPLVARARATMQRFTGHIASDPIMAELDGNEVLPETAITGPLRSKLAEISAALG